MSTLDRLLNSVKESELNPNYEMDDHAKREILFAVAVVKQKMADIEQEIETLADLADENSEKPKIVYGPVSPEMLKMAASVASQLKSMLPHSSAS